jgi:hypothetical protein
MSAKNDRGPIIVGGEPRIDFLPPETKKRKENKRQRRSLVALVFMVLIACAVGFVFSASFAASSQAALDAERLKTGVLQREELKYVEAQTAQADIDGARNARLVGSATEIMWSDYLNGLLAGMPEGATVLEISVDSQSALELTPVPDAPLQQPRVATLSLSLNVGDLFVARSVITYLKTVPAFADVRASSLALGQDSGYGMSVVLNINSDAFERRFFENPPADTPADATTEDEG